MGKHALALQFHAEATRKSVGPWLIGHACEIAATPGISPEALREQTARFAPALEVQGPKCFADFLDAAGLKSHVSPRHKK